MQIEYKRGNNMLKKDMKIRIEELEALNSNLEQNNQTLTLYAKQLQTKMQEVGAIVEHYEKTILVMGKRLQEKGALINEQNSDVNRRVD
tara:strand:- start:431 stop:697 length:267 start_codon:yes stop_codon:yes gene_type:complete